MKSKLWYLPAVAAAIVTTAVFLSAQNGSQGTITVTVTDQSGAVVPAAELTLRNLATNDVRKATTQAVGSYTFVDLNGGTYKLTASKAGYAHTVYDKIAVQASRVTDINAVLKVGAISETVTVQAEAVPLVESTSSTIGSNIDLKQIEDLPLSDRDLTALVVLSPGFTGGNYNPGVYGVNSGTWNGLPGAAQVACMDGVIAQSSRFKDYGNAQPYSTAASPRIQNIQEMAIQTDQLEANQGYGQGNMQVTYVTRSGTNHFHGRLFADLQNSSFNANSWQNDFNGVPIPLYHKTDWGGSVGGPILKDKLFFFFSFERDGIPGALQLSSPFMTPSMQQGIYTYLGTDNNVHTVNLLTLAGAGGANATADPTVAAEITKINGSLASGTVATIPGVPYNVQQVIFREPNNQYWDYPTFRVDYNATQKLRVNFALNETKYSAPTALAPTFPGTAFAYQSSGNSSNAYTASLGIDYTVRPTLVNQFRIGYLYNSSVSANNQAGDPEKYKFIDYWNGVDGLSYQCPNGLPCSGDVFYSRVNYFYPLINFSDNIVWQHKSHAISFGVSFYREQDHYWNPPAGWTGLALGLTGGDPALNVFTSSNPALATANPTQIGEMQGFYSIVAGDIDNLGGSHPLDLQTHTYIRNTARITSMSCRRRGGCSSRTPGACGLILR
ncbi:MAG: carboxypeptidase-like regulatory domain-containing protein [Candidatus Sulfotelmatobacter sp.]